MAAKTDSAVRLLRAFTGRTYTRNKPEAKDPVVSILTYPVRDYAGDYVRPDGGDWSPFEKYPVVNWNHRCPIGRGKVSLKKLKFDGETTPVHVGETTVFFKTAEDLKGVNLTKYNDPVIRKAIGKYSIDEALTIAGQAERLIRDDIATGVSIEFREKGEPGEAFWDLDEKSLLEDRSARHFENWYGYGYAHARTPINPGCRTLVPDPKELVEKAYSIARTGKLLDGTQLHPLILKAFTDDDELLSVYKRVTVPVRLNVKGVDKDETDVDGVGGTDTDKDEEDVLVLDDTAGKEEPSAGARALLNGAQFLMDACDALEEDGGQSDSVKVRKFISKICAKIKSLAGECTEQAESLKKELDAATGRLEEDEDGDGNDDTDSEIDDEDEDADSDDDEGAEEAELAKKGKEDEDDDDEDDRPKKKGKAYTPPDVDAEGYIICKAFSGWKPRRFSRANIAELIDVDEQDEINKQYERAQKRLKKVLREAKQLVEAGKT